MLDRLKVGLDALQNKQVFVCADNRAKVIRADIMLKE